MQNSVWRTIEHLILITIASIFSIVTFLDKTQPMITQKKVKIDDSFKGDTDGWTRMASREEKAIMSDWSLIDGLAQDIQLVKKRLASKEFSDTLQRRLAENCDNSETINQLREMGVFQIFPADLRAKAGVRLGLTTAGHAQIND